jgi:hypothetical protein
MEWLTRGNAFPVTILRSKVRPLGRGRIFVVSRTKFQLNIFGHDSFFLWRAPRGKNREKFGNGFEFLLGAISDLSPKSQLMLWKTARHNLEKRLSKPRDQSYT